MIKEEFGILLKELRLKNGLTQEKLAEMAGCDYKFYQSLEYGKHLPSLEIIFGLSAALDLKPSEFVLLLEEKLKK